MFLFTKSRKDIGSDYRKLEDVETGDHLPPDSEKFSQDEHQLDYRAAFYGLSVAYVLTVILGLSLWKFGSNTDTSGAAAPSKMMEIPRNQQILFQKADEFEAKNDSKGVDDAWASLIPTGKGFVEIENQHYCISMFHQLHCIATLKTAFEAGDNENAHLGHCFDYLRQGVMCAGDMTLEPVLELGTDKVQVVDGWNVVHQCRNYDTMMGFAETHRYLNTTGIH